MCPLRFSLNLPKFVVEMVPKNHKFGPCVILLAIMCVWRDNDIGLSDYGCCYKHAILANNSSLSHHLNVPQSTRWQNGARTSDGRQTAATVALSTTSVQQSRQARVTRRLSRPRTVSFPHPTTRSITPLNRLPLPPSLARLNQFEDTIKRQLESPTIMN